jgi:hypothetical protein
MLYLAEATIGERQNVVFAARNAAGKENTSRPGSNVTCGPNVLRISGIWRLDPSSATTRDPATEAPLQHAPNRFLNGAFVVLAVKEHG